MSSNKKNNISNCNFKISRKKTGSFNSLEKFKESSDSETDKNNNDKPNQSDSKRSNSENNKNQISKNKIKKNNSKSKNDSKNSSKSKSQNKSDSKSNSKSKSKNNSITSENENQPKKFIDYNKFLNRKRRLKEDSEDSENETNKKDRETIDVPVSVDILTPKDKDSNENSDISNKNPYKLPKIIPWIKKNSLTNQHKGILKLHYEILDFYKFIKPTKEEQNLFMSVFNIIKKEILSLYPTWEVKLFGSFPLKLNLPYSDIDIEILPKLENNKNKDNNKSEIQILEKISNHILTNLDSSFAYVEIIKAKVPIIKAKYITPEKRTINIDISIFRINGYYAKNTISKMLKEEYQFMRPLLYVLKFYVYQKKLNELYHGGISSFILFNLLYFYILTVRKEQIKKHIYNSKNLLTLGHLLIGFFQYYGNDFNYEKLGFSIKNGGYIYQRQKKFPQSNYKKYLLSIEDYQDTCQDIGMNCYKFNKIIECFKNARDALYFPTEEKITSYLALFIKVDDDINKRKFYLDKIKHSDNSESDDEDSDSQEVINLEE